MRFSRLAVVAATMFSAGADCLQGQGQEAANTKGTQSSDAVVVVDVRGDREMQRLFDDKTLAGWEGNQKWFRVEGSDNGHNAIVAGSLTESIPNNEFLCTEKSYSDFELVVEVRLKGTGDNAGIQFRSARVPNDHEVSGYQCDVGSAWDRPVWGGLYDESRRNKMLAEGPADKLGEWLKKDDWNELRVLAEGDHIQIFLNGHQTVDYREEDDTIPREGVIALQIHSGPPTEAWYRSVWIREIKAK